MSTRKDIHWFYTSCDVVAMESVISDKELKTKINVYLTALNERIIELKKMIAKKVDTRVYKQQEYTTPYISLWVCYAYLFRLQNQW